MHGREIAETAGAPVSMAKIGPLIIDQRRRAAFDRVLSVRVVEDATVSGRAPFRVGAVLTAAVAALLSLTQPLFAQEAAPLTAAWLRQARIAGADLPNKMTAGQIDTSLAALAAQNVSVIEADSDLSRFMTDGEFDAKLDLMRHNHANRARPKGSKTKPSSLDVTAKSAHPQDQDLSHPGNIN